MCLVDVDTGSVVLIPFRGSRMIAEKHDDAAEFGFPGRTVMVGRRSDSPLMNPFLLKSATISSVASFWAPYEVRGSQILKSSTAPSNGGP